jgi:uncharacterized protein YndB with AHSA1/START domain
MTRTLTILALCVGLLAAATDAPVSVSKLDLPEKALHFEVTVPAPVGEVWNAFTTRDGLASWLWPDVRVDLREGGDWLVLYPEGKTGGGTILAFSPQRRLVLSAMAPEQFPEVRRERTRAVFEFHGLTPSSTRVTLTQTGWKQGKEWNDAYDYLANGNAILLRQLYRRFAVGPIDWKKPK